MKVVLVNGSPHPKGCTYTALTQIIKILTDEGIETSQFWIGNKPIGGCIACHKCKDTGLCIFGGIVNEFLEQASQYDGFIFGTPVHLGASSGNIKSFMDRIIYADYIGKKERFLFKPAASVTSARRSGIVSSTDQLNHYFSLTQMPIVTSRYWNSVHGMDATQASEDAEGMQTMRILARNMAWILKCLEAGKNAGVPMPKQEEVIYTNFIDRC